MTQYQFFEVEDFLEDNAFRRWVFAPLPADDDFWQQWLLQYPEKRNTVRQARQLLLDIRGEQMPLSDARIHLKVTELVEQARFAQTEQLDKEPYFHSARSLWYFLAASVVLLLGIATWTYWTPRAQPTDSPYTQLLTQAEVPLLEVSNTSDSPRHIVLADSSTVTLHKNSRLSYPKQFDKTKREVYLTGEAFFTVAKNPAKPFLVYANELVTKVLGTSFRVQAYEQDKHVIVSVKTGKVSVFAQSDEPLAKQKNSRELTGIILMPNQQATLLREDIRLVRSLVEEPELVQGVAASQRFVFKHTPVAEVFAALEQAYSVDVVFDEVLLANCTLTASLGEETLFKKLDWICAASESTYEVVDGQIIITSRGCE